MIKWITIFLLLLLPALSLSAQELQCQVIVNAELAQTTDRQVFRDMEQAFARFMNERKWTEDFYSPEEKINCNLMITIETMITVSSYKATVQIQSSRPVYNTNYESLVFNFADRNWTFEYVESTPLDFNDNQFMSNITSMLAYYAYIILGIDYDTFSEFGGERMFQKALNVVNVAQTTDMSGWRAFQSNRNRYWLIDNLMNQNLQPIRAGYYKYHRIGLDNMIDKPDQSRQEIMQCLKNIKTADKLLPNTILKISFFDAKADELVSIFKKAQPAVKNEAYNLLTEINPTNTEKYKMIIGN